MKGATYSNQANPEGIKLDYEPDPNMDIESDSMYMMVSGPEGVMIDVPDLGEQLISLGLKRTTLRSGDLKKRGIDKSEEPDISAGFWYRNTKRMPKGKYEYTFYHVYPFKFNDKKVQEVLNMVEHPVGIEARPISRN